MITPSPEPVFFGAEDRPLFGWLHRAPCGPRTPLGVVLCNPFGYEAICAHRPIRHFATAMAAAGFPALRFDYDGTGDSAGTDLEPDRLRAWISSIHQAAELLRREAGVERLCFLGTRLGATLAALAAGERTDVDSLIAIAPVVNARGYTRELRALQRAAGARPESGDTTGDDRLEATGFVVTSDTRASLADVDLCKLERFPAPRVLILDRNDLPGGERWAAHLERTGAKAERRVVSGYVEMMLAPHANVVPDEMLRLASGWLVNRVEAIRSLPTEPSQQHTASAPAARRSITLPAKDSGLPIVESLEFLDSAGTLFGVLTAPRSQPPAAAARAGILLLNAGATHHVGPNRLYVGLARRWAALGHVVLRMDVAGIGDSPPKPGEPENVVYAPRAGEDVAQAAQYLREHAGVTECYALGLCAGAYHAFKAAVGGVPLDAVVMINPLTFFWKDGMSLDAKLADQRVIAEARRYQRTAFSLQSWLKLVSGRVDIANVARILVRRAYATVNHTWRDFARRLHLPLTDDLASELESLARRGTSMLFVFAANDPGIELLRLQGGSTVGKLRGRQQLDVRIISDADHTFTSSRARDQLVSILLGAVSEVSPST